MDITYFTGDYYSDSAIMFDYLNELELVTGAERSGSKFFSNRNIKHKPDSTKVGYTWRKRRGNFDREYCPIHKLYKTKLNEDLPHLMNIFKEFRNHHFSGFEFSEITINKMYVGSKIKQHLDKINVGDSVLVAFGDYTGGKTIIQDEFNNNFSVVDARESPIIFNGSERLHSVTTINSGLRYSLVFYKNKLKSIEPY